MVCECDWFKELSTQPGSCIEIVSERQQLEGYKVAVVKDWILKYDYAYIVETMYVHVCVFTVYLLIVT